jgi:hypothetical protein
VERTLIESCEGFSNAVPHTTGETCLKGHDGLYRAGTCGNTYHVSTSNEQCCTNRRIRHGSCAYMHDWCAEAASPIEIHIPITVPSHTTSKSFP